MHIENVLVIVIVTVNTFCSHGFIKLVSNTKIRTNLADSRKSDVVIIGSGIGGLCCGALLARCGLNVVVCESHYEIGGCAHEFFYDEVGRLVTSGSLAGNRSDLFRFEAGPSLYAGLSPQNSPNPLKHVFQMIEEEPEWITYDTWGAFLPECSEGFKMSIGAVAFEDVLRKYGGPSALSDWTKISNAMRPLAAAVMNLPTVAFRPDAGNLVTKYVIKS